MQNGEPAIAEVVIVLVEIKSVIAISSMFNLFDPPVSLVILILIKSPVTFTVNTCAVKVVDEVVMFAL